MASLGTLIILTAFVLAGAAFAASVAGARRRDTRLTNAGVALFHTVTALSLVVSAIIIHAFIIGDYSIKYIQHYSDAMQSMFYKITSYWGGLDGSLLFWVALLEPF
ncbi:MAG: heme lyase CcmF/NrfE family subunit, partial [Acidobacteria bacterium]|nr:heme lyase CcmF/NrfE family subunit [Acidobacteriota bacterium]